MCAGVAIAVEFVGAFLERGHHPAKGTVEIGPGQPLENLVLEREIDAEIDFAPAFDGVEAPVVLKIAQRPVDIVDPDTLGPVFLHPRGELLADRLEPDDHVRNHLSFAVGLNPGRDHPWQELGVTLHVGDQIGEAHILIDQATFAPGARRLRRQIGKLARSQAPLYISGESGSGKELVARAVHDQSERSSSAFVAVNCGAIPENLLESELFGHVKGAFTGAVQNKEGLFETAEHGTLFLDEIGDMSPLLQAKILRVLQEREVEAVGAEEIIKVDVRVLAATHQDLEKLIEVAGKDQQEFEPFQ